MILNNPDVIAATPGRLLHLVVEMNLDLKSEILPRLPPTRQTLLFSVTLLKSLVEFAKAGLENPKLVQLDAESKISSDLCIAFFSEKQTEKDASLLVLLRDVIGVPLGDPTVKNKYNADGTDRKGKTKMKYSDQITAPHQTVVFAATKHHVEYLTHLLLTTGYAVSQIYGSLDQSARSQQMDKFRKGYTNIPVVTDVAARGIDTSVGPVLENVVNYEFTSSARVFVHRVGHTAGQQGAGRGRLSQTRNCPTCSGYIH